MTTVNSFRKSSAAVKFSGDILLQSAALKE
jgi:hypothetical protein